MKFLPLALSAVLLAGCATSQNATVTTANVVAKVQADYPVIKAAIGAYTASGHASPDVVAAVAKAEAVLDPEVAALSSVTPPTTVKGVVGDISAELAALPAGAIPADAQADVTLLLALVNAGLVTAG